MPKIERKIKVESTPEQIYNIIKDGINTPKWNLTVSAISFEGDITKLESDYGSLKIIKAERERNKFVSWFMEESNMNSIGYILTPKKEDVTEVSVWIEYDDKSFSKLFKKNGDLVLTGLKSYAEFIEKGGDSEAYNKWEVIPTP